MARPMRIQSRRWANFTMAKINQLGCQVGSETKPEVKFEFTRKSKWDSDKKKPNPRKTPDRKWHQTGSDTKPEVKAIRARKGWGKRCWYVCINPTGLNKRSVVCQHRRLTSRQMVTANCYYIDLTPLFNSFQFNSSNHSIKYHFR